MQGKEQLTKETSPSVIDNDFTSIGFCGIYMGPGLDNLVHYAQSILRWLNVSNSQNNKISHECFNSYHKERSGGIGLSSK